jgi:hypothetical protein
VVQLVIDQNPEVDAVDNHGRTPLWYACNYGRNTAIVPLLLEHQANANTRSIDRATALQAACFHGQLDIVKLLIERGAKVNEHGFAGATALHWAVDGRQKETVAFLLQQKAQVNALDEAGRTPLQWAKDELVDATPAEEKVIPLDETNVYVLEGVPVGEVEVLVEADLLKPHTESVIVSEGSPAEIEVKLEPAASEGSQLRGLVRSYSGQGIAASVTVEPGDHTTKCDEEGSFELDLPPGVYKVIIEAEGYRSQRRTLRVRKEGVTVLNADLQQAAP